MSWIDFVYISYNIHFSMSEKNIQINWIYFVLVVTFILVCQMLQMYKSYYISIFCQAYFWMQLVYSTDIYQYWKYSKINKYLSVLLYVNCLVRNWQFSFSMLSLLNKWCRQYKWLVLLLSRKQIHHNLVLLMFIWFCLKTVSILSWIPY
jgi:hypothetical protein